MVSAADLKNALIHEQDHAGGDAVARVSELQEEYFDADGPTTLIWFKVVDGTLMVTLTLFTNWPESGDESETIDRISRLVARCFGDVAQSWTTLP